MNRDIKTEIETVSKNLTSAYNNGLFDPAHFCTEDCQLYAAGKVFQGHKALADLVNPSIKQTLVIDEIGPEDATDLAYSRGSFVMFNTNEEVVNSGRCVSIWKKVDGKWYMHRDIPMTCIKLKRDDYKELLAVEQEMVEAFNNGSKTLARFCTPDTSLLAMRKEAMGGHEGIHRFNHPLKQVTAVDGVSTNKSFTCAVVKGYFILYRSWDKIKSGRFKSVWRNISGKWLLHRDYPDVDQYWLGSALEYDHLVIRRIAVRLSAAYNRSEVDPSKFYSTDCLLVPPRGDYSVDYRALSEVLKKNGDLADCNKQVVSVTHEVIANDNDSFAYERGHYLNYSKDGGVIISGGEYVTMWKKENGRWLIHRDIPHMCYSTSPWDPEVFREILAVASKVFTADSSGGGNVSNYYTKDCTIAVPGKETLHGHQDVEREYKLMFCTANSLTRVVDEIGPVTATNLCYYKGVSILKGPNEEMIKDCRFECILKKVDGKWLIWREMSKASCLHCKQLHSN